MKKKGFTLIELLAVIVILAIIALIATPLVLKYIEKSRQESKVDSAYSFVRNLETQMANFAINNNGKKYTTDKENIKELGLDITVKGENPEDGKVCISIAGQIEKGIFKYNNYYVIYDGKTATISDKESYNNFSCGKINDVSFELNADFEYIVEKEDEYSSSSIDVSSLSFDNLEKGYEYDLLIDDVFVTTVLVVNLDGYITIKSTDSDKNIDVEGDNEELYIRTSFKIEGNHNIKLCNKQEPKIKALLYVENGGSIILNGLNFVEGKAHILITDADGIKYFDDSIDLIVNGFEDIYGVDSPCRENISEIPNIFAAAANDKKITTVVTQEINGEKVITTISGETKYFAHPEYDAYYWGQYALVVDGWC